MQVSDLSLHIVIGLSSGLVGGSLGVGGGFFVHWYQSIFLLKL